MEANQNITMEPYNIEYYIGKYGTVGNLTKDYIGAIDGLRLQYRQYETNPRKGGRYRREKLEHLRQQTEAIYHELLRVSRAMKDYFAAQAAETSRISTETAETVNVSAEGEKEAETQEIGRKPEGREAVCRLAPAWAAKKVLKYGYILYCFNLYPNGEFSISVENRDGCRVLTKDEFRKLCSETTQSPETPQTAEYIGDPKKLAQTV